MKWYIKVLKNYFTFSGRARRKEYWMFTLFNFLVAFLIGFCAGISSVITGKKEIIDWTTNIYQLLVLIPSIAVGVRRVHDSNHKGWWVLVPFYNLFLFIIEGDQGPNRFGPDPKVDERTANTPVQA